MLDRRRGQLDAHKNNCDNTMLRLVFISQIRTNSTVRIAAASGQLCYKCVPQKHTQTNLSMTKPSSRMSSRSPEASREELDGNPEIRTLLPVDCLVGCRLGGPLLAELWLFGLPLVPAQHNTMVDSKFDTTANKQMEAATITKSKRHE